MPPFTGQTLADAHADARVGGAMPSALRAAARAFADHWLPRACALCDQPLRAREPGLCDRCALDLPGRDAIRCPACALRLPSTECAPATGCEPPAATRGAAPRVGHTAIPGGACPGCAATPPGPDQSIVLADYAPPLDRLIVALKFRAELSAARPLGELLARALVGQARQPPALLAPVPLSPERLAVRGFNQSRAIAAALGRRLRLRVDAGLLARMRDTPAQSGLPLAARHGNLAGAILARRRVEGLVVAVVDDVMTSGATAQAAALALKAAGARFVIHLAAARTP